MVLSGPYVSVMENPTLEEIAREVIDCAYHIHVELGPGLLESVYEVVLAKALEERGYRVVRQVPIKIQFRDLKFDEGFRADLIVNDCFLIELKSVEKTSPVHAKQTLTYLRLLKFPLGLLLNFGAATLKEGAQRIVNQHQGVASSGLRIHQESSV